MSVDELNRGRNRSNPLCPELKHAAYQMSTNVAEGTDTLAKMVRSCEAYKKEQVLAPPSCLRIEKEAVLRYYLRLQGTNTSTFKHCVAGFGYSRFSNRVVLIEVINLSTRTLGWFNEVCQATDSTICQRQL